MKEMPPIKVRRIRKRPHFKRRYRIASRAQRDVQRKTEAWLDAPTYSGEVPDRKAKLVMMSKETMRYLKRLGDGSLADGLEIAVDIVQDIGLLVLTQKDIVEKIDAKKKRR